MTEVKHDTASHVFAGGFGVRAPGCPACPPPRDPRWENVQGGMTRHDSDPPDTVRLTVELDGDYCTYLLSDVMRKRAYADPLGMILDEMVRQLDG